MWYDEKVQNRKVANEQQHQRRVWWENDRIIIKDEKKKVVASSMMLLMGWSGRCRRDAIYIYFRECSHGSLLFGKWKARVMEMKRPHVPEAVFFRMKLLRNVQRTKFGFTKRWQWSGCETKSWKVAIHLHFGWRQRLFKLSLRHGSDNSAHSKSTTDSFIEHNSRSSRIFASRKFLFMNHSHFTLLMVGIFAFHSMRRKM